MRTKAILLAGTLMLIADSLFADPANPALQKRIKLEDGRMITACMVGDEYGYYWKDVNNGLCYLETTGTDRFHEIEAEAVIKASRVRRMETVKNRMEMVTLRKTDKKKRDQARSDARYRLQIDPYVGNKRVPVILVEFNDCSFWPEHTTALYHRIYNEEGFNEGRFKGSVRDYFLAQSDGKTDITFDVYGPVKMANGYKYYGADESHSTGQHLDELLTLACQAVDNMADFSVYDCDGDGYVDQVFIMFAGFGRTSGGDANTIWPHVSNVPAFSCDGVKISTYGCAAELTKIYLSGTNDSPIDHINGIGTICHEISHCLGLPDLYDGDGNNYGVNRWDVMGNGGHNDNGFTPAGYTAMSKMLMGWQQPIELEKDTVIEGIEPMSSGGDFYLIRNDNYANEYYLLENRQQTGWDEKLPGHGMLITHVDYNEMLFEHNAVNFIGKYGNNHERISVIPADNDYIRTDSGRSGDLFPYGDNNSLTNTTSPPASLWNRNTDGFYFMNKPITNISEIDGRMSFTFRNEQDASIERIRPIRIDVQSAGTLGADWSPDELYGIDSLKITGPLNGADLLTLRKMAGRDEKAGVTFGCLQYLDLSEAHFVPSDDVYFISTSTDSDPKEYMLAEEDVIPEHAFHGLSLSHLILPQTTKTIGRYAFYNCKYLETVVLNEGLKEIEYAAYWRTPLTSVVLPNSVERIGSWTFAGMGNLTSVIIGNSVTAISYAAFKDCPNLIDIQFGENIKTISASAFEGCTALESIILPASVKDIKDNAFKDADSIADIISYQDSPKAISESSFSETCFQNACLYVPAGTKSSYKQLAGWQKFSHIEEMEPVGIAETVPPSGRPNIYDLLGRKRNRPQCGINVLRMNDGRTMKVLLKGHNH